MMDATSGLQRTVTKLMLFLTLIMFGLTAESALAQASRPQEPAIRQTESSGADQSLFESMFNSDQSGPVSGGSFVEEILIMVFRLTAAALLATLLTLRPRRGRIAMRRNLQVAQTQVLLAVVASALMMIVADNAARAFGIFAAASLVRFRTNIKDPKEITILLISLGIGLATGVGRWKLGLVLSLFTLVVVWLLEWREPARLFRPMELTVKTYNTDGTEAALKRIFKTHDFKAELLEMNRSDEIDPKGKIVYYVNVAPRISTDELSEEIFLADPRNIDSVQWRHNKGSTLG